MFLSAWTNLDLLSVGVSVATSVILGFVVLLNDSKNMTNRAFFYFSLVNGLWGTVNYMQYRLEDTVFILLTLRLVMFSAVWQAFTFFHLAYIFPSERTTFPSWFIRLLVPAVSAVSVFTLTSLIFSSIRTPMIPGEIAEAIPGPGIPIFGITAVGLVLAGIFLLAKKLLRATESMLKTQVRLFLAGIAIMFGLIIFGNFVLPVFLKNLTFIPLGAVFTMPFIALTGYAILKHHLFNTKVIATEILTFAIWILLFLRIFGDETLESQMTDGGLLLLVITFGILLIKSVKKEVSQREQLEILSQAKSEFISIASHQLRTPLSAVKGYISMLIEGTYGPLNEEEKKTLQKIYVSNERLVALVNDLLNVSQAEQGRLSYAFEKIPIADMIENVVNDLAIGANIKNISLVWHKPPNTAMFEIQADGEKLRQAILNLIDNAIKYTERGGIEVRLEKDINPMYARITVKDTGIGLTLEDKEKIFQKFSRGKEGTKTNAGGSGIGLFIAKRIVEDHNGRLWAESDGPGKGSAFIITIPFAQQKSIS